MPSCKLTKSINNTTCDYSVAGASKIWLFNWYPAAIGTASATGVVTYEIDEDGYVAGIFLPTGEVFYELDGEANSLNFTDTLLVGGSGGKYRQHSVTAVIGQNDLDMLNQNDALALGTFGAVALDKSGKLFLLGRTGGLTAPAGGNDFNSGTAAADANGTTVILQGDQGETRKLLLSAAVVTPVFVAPVVIP